MMLHDDAVKQTVDRYMIERFITATEVSARKVEMYAELSQQQEVSRHFQTMAKFNERAQSQLQNLHQNVSG